MNRQQRNCGIVATCVLASMLSYATAYAQDRPFGRPHLAEAILYLVPTAEFRLEDSGDIRSLVWIGGGVQPDDSAILAVTPLQVSDAHEASTRGRRAELPTNSFFLTKLAALTGQTYAQIKAEYIAFLAAR